jgi:two-component system, OmpR family, sensor histidine kinase ChvG
MARAIASPMTADLSAPCDEPQRLVWSARWSLTTRILAVNIFAIALLAVGFFYLDSYRTRLIDARIAGLDGQLSLLAPALEAARPEERARLVQRFTSQNGSRLRFYHSDGRLLADSFIGARPTYTLRNPDDQPWFREAARIMDRALDWVVGAPIPSPYVEPAADVVASWPELVAAQSTGRLAHRYRYAPDRTPMLSAAVPVRFDDRALILMTVNARDITRTVRAERWRLGVVLGVVTLASVLLSLFLARTIVDPLRRLARAAVQVRLGRAREVIVPRLPSRRDEIGTLARALSDMTQTLRERIDAGEHFAADVSHELKNPIASLRSAVEGLERVTDPGQRQQLLTIAGEDVRRLDRLVSDISEASHMDAELSRTRFERIDLGVMIEAMLAGRAARRDAGEAGPRIAFARPRKGTAEVMGDGHRLERAIDNVIDNALSFSPDDGLVCVAATSALGQVRIRIDDEGPGIAIGQREAVFRRFHSERPVGEAFGRHSGLGLAIARTIIEGHQGSIVALDRDDGRSGASILISLPAA